MSLAENLETLKSLEKTLVATLQHFNYNWNFYAINSNEYCVIRDRPTKDNHCKIFVFEKAWRFYAWCLNKEFKVIKEFDWKAENDRLLEEGRAEYAASLTGWDKWYHQNEQSINDTLMAIGCIAAAPFAIGAQLGLSPLYAATAVGSLVSDD